MIPETTPHKYAHHLSYWFDHKSREYGQIMPQSQTTDQPLHREEETHYSHSHMTAKKKKTKKKNKKKTKKKHQLAFPRRHYRKTRKNN